MTNINRAVLEKNIARCRERKIVIPTYRQMRMPDQIPEGIQDALRSIEMDDLNSLNLFRITWKNEPGGNGGFGGVNYIEIPPQLSGVEARIFMLIGSHFPTGAHKVGATFGPLVEKVVTGKFDTTSQKAMWPSTGNYCRGGTYDSYLLGCESIAVLPEGVSHERIAWLQQSGAEVHIVSGIQSGIKEVYDRVKEIEKERGDEVVTLNQFSEIGNPLWHYSVTGPAIEEVYNQEKNEHSSLAGLFLTQGSAGTLGSGDYLRGVYPGMKIAAGEALQCPTLLYNGYGKHRIEGIGDKHVPWIHNIKNMDMVVGVDDQVTLRLMRLFNEPEGHQYLKDMGLSAQFVEKLDLLGLSAIANLAGAIKMAKYFEWNSNQHIFTVATDSMALYQSRLFQLRHQNGRYSKTQAAIDYEGCLRALSIDHVQELSYYDKKSIHNLKYFTWVEQQGKTIEELNAQWYEDEYWQCHYNLTEEWDKRIEEFNHLTGAAEFYK